MNIPIVKSKEQLNFYKEYGPEFGAILKSCKEAIESGNLKNGCEVESFLTEKTYNSRIYKNSIICDFCFESEINQSGEKFRAICCISINNQIGHTKPTNKPFNNTDIISVDFGLRVLSNNLNNPLYFDGGFTTKIGENRSYLLTWIDSPLKAIKAIKNISVFHSNTRTISRKIEDTAINLEVDSVLSIAGHGIGLSLHEAPKIYNAITKLDSGYPLIEGLVFCVEPIFVEREDLDIFNYVKTYIDYDGWSIKTINGQNATHFETMFAIENFEIIDLLGLSEW